MSEGHTGGMIALVPDDPDALAVASGDPADEMHCTLVFLGDDMASHDDDTLAALKEGVAQLAQVTAPIQARIMGHGYWNPDGGPDGDMDPCAVYELDAPRELIELRELADGQGAASLSDDYPDQFTPYRPHVTAGFNITPAGADMSASGPVTFSTLRLAIGDDVHDYPLTGGEGGDTDVTAAAAPPVVDDAPDVAVPELDDSNGVPLYFPVVMVEGMPTSDGREITPGALTHRALPLPVLAQTANPVGGGGHDGAEVVGRIDVLQRTPGPETIDQRTGQILIDKETGEPFPEGTFVWWANGFGDPDAKGIQLAQKGYLTGNSADLTEMDVDYDYGVDDDADEGDKILAIMGDDKPPKLTVTKATVAATTLVPIPAFAQSYVVVGGETMTPNSETASLTASPMFRSADLGDTCSPCEAGLAITTAERKDAAKAGEAMPDGSYPIRNAADLDNAIRAVGRGSGNHDAIRKHIIVRAKALGLPDKIPADWGPDGSITASAVGTLPPRAAFADPEFTGPTPLTIVEDGDHLRVFGHLGQWGTCHTGFANQCLLMPQSKSDYAYFNVGAVRTDGGDVAAGHITMGAGGHAGMGLSAADAAAYYDDVNTVVADVAAGPDAFGVWVSGIVRRTATPEQVDALRASPLSGDWRRIDGGMELVAALAVNSGGFPVPRARVASGAPMALVAAGVVRPDVAPDQAIGDELSLRRRAALARIAAG